MANTVTIQREYVLAIRRCYQCGNHWAYEERGGTGTCPICADRALTAARARYAILERSNAALRGALTRAKGRKG